MLSQFCRRGPSQEQLATLQGKVTQELQALLAGLEAHYKQLSQAPLAPAGSSSFRAGGAATVGLVAGGRWGGAAAAVGDSSRELASLHNLIERLRLDEPGFEVMMAAGY